MKYEGAMCVEDARSSFRAMSTAPRVTRDSCQSRCSEDLLITGGRVVDGIGTPAFAADIGVSGESITRIGDLGTATPEALSSRQASSTRTRRRVASMCLAPPATSD